MYGLHNVIHRLSSALNQLKLENPGGGLFPILINLNLIKSKQIRGANLALTSATIADAREVCEIVIEIQLMVLYAMKIYCKHISGRDMGIFWCQPLILVPLRTEAAVSGELGLVDNST